MSIRKIRSRAHAVAGVLAFLIILSFMTASAWAELFGEGAFIAQVKSGIAWSLLLLVPAIAAAGMTGFSMVGARPKGLAATKMWRMRLIAVNGLLVLTPSALFLAWKAGSSVFDWQFALVQAIEFVAGAANLLLIGLNIRDGMKITGRLRRSAPGKLREASR